MLWYSIIYEERNSKYQSYYLIGCTAQDITTGSVASTNFKPPSTQCSADTIKILSGNGVLYTGGLQLPQQPVEIGEK